MKFSIIVPSFNERENIPVIVDKLQNVLKDIDYEIIVVDDNSPDKTWDLVEQMSHEDSRVKVIRRIGRNGLSSAVIEGFLAATGEYLGVIDADLQHDPVLLTEMLNEIENNDLDIVIASRYTETKDVEGWSRTRLFISDVATKLAQLVIKYKVTDPMSGYFVLKKSVVQENVEKFYGKGFKILLDIMSVKNDLRIKEIPYTFTNRLHGESKLGNDVIFQYVEFLLERLFGKHVETEYIKYMIVGSFGALLHFSILTLFYKNIGYTYSISLAIAILVAILFNYIYNNIWTFKDYRLTDISLITGYLKYNLLCFVGALANYSVSMYLIDHMSWIIASMVGAFVGANWNYLTNSIYTWKTKHP
ncbi:glycosyltransferase family 2 protein [Methanococcoides burtonii]|uniref:Dolichyl-phosphate beta-D-mannosyltransferase like protein with GtrA-like C-terminal domain n=1 Tax=Methanococcoides burtonii (strain DSM 6242 / NBRC 107633 / OCM 468 / ACE-M) TaxID=259564 RepID=Q12VK7_METBU|nr:glycosyltransferase family 2 protein [Methanococcoides burtonii]ABE52519.1 Dolichyl-phosphate beta-D-mannosyltransferase like protein with GtrA-like C-terminal domain [Methanococcoides burtonii DSM 6242]